MGNAQASHADHHRRHSGGRGGQGGIILPNDKAPGFGNRETSPYEPVRLSAVTKKYYVLNNMVGIILFYFFKLDWASRCTLTTTNKSNPNRSPSQSSSTKSYDRIRS